MADKEDDEKEPRSRRRAAEEEPEQAAFHMHEVAAPGIRAYQAATALGSTPGELAAALYDAEGNGPYTAEDIQAAVQAYRNREIPAG